MDMSGEQRIGAEQHVVWAALNDPEILRRCIPGCKSLERLSDTQLRGVAVIKVGPVSARFVGDVTLSEIDAPNGYRIQGEGQGGVAGFAKGGARVRLMPDGVETVLHYEVSVQVGGKLAQLGARLIDATAKQLSKAFFKRFAEELTGPVAASAANAFDVPGTAPLLAGKSQRGAAAGVRLSAASLSAGSGLAWAITAIASALLVVVVLADHVIAPDLWAPMALGMAGMTGYALGRARQVIVVVDDRSV